VRTLIRKDKMKKEAQQGLEASLLEGLNSGEAVSATPEYWSELKSELEIETKNRL
jgi:hypothetical protein